jgi:transcriptional regulator with XRE-family HTH domain
VRALLHTEFAALLARADISQAAFARLSGYTPRQVNNWARGRAAAPLWAIALAAVLQHTSPEAILILLEEIEFAWHETLGVPPNADVAALRRAMARLALIYHPDKGGQPDLMRRADQPHRRRGGHPGTARCVRGRRRIVRRHRGRAGLVRCRGADCVSWRVLPDVAFSGS